MPVYINGIPHATSTDRIDLWPTTSRTLAEWIDQNAVRTTDPRMTDARPPTTHTHHRLDNPYGYVTLDASGGLQHWVNEGRRWWVDATGTLVEGTVPPARVSGLADRLAALEYDSGLRDVTSVLSLQSGSVRLHVRSGFVWLDFSNVVLDGTGVVVLTETALASVAPALPMGDTSFTAVTLAGSARRVALNRHGQLRVFGVGAGDSLNGSGAWPMRRPVPIPLLGDPA